MGISPTLASVGSLRTWTRIMLSPASTMHYVDEYFDREAIDRQKVYMPGVIYAFLGFMRLLSLPFRRMTNQTNRNER